MARTNVCVDDQTNVISLDPNPAGWLIVSVAVIGTEPSVDLAFENWTNFRHWVEKNDPDCGVQLDPPKTRAASRRTTKR